MASVAEILYDIDNVFHDLEILYNNRETIAVLLFTAAQTIQKWIRGWLIRRRLSFLNQNATIIQAIWRGYLGRKIYRQLLELRVKEMYVNYYNKMATRIQSFWRGFYVRWRIFNYYELKAWIRMILNSNETMTNKLHEFGILVNNEKMDALEKEAKEWVLFILFKLHHLVRTKNRKGVYSLKTRTEELSPFETQLKSLKFFKYIQKSHEDRRNQQFMSGDPVTLHIFNDCRMKQFEKCWHESKKPHKYSVFLGDPWESPRTKEREQNIKYKNQINNKRMCFYFPKKNDPPMYRTFGSIVPKTPKNPLDQLPREKRFRTYEKPPKYFDSENLCDYYGPHKPLPKMTLYVSNDPAKVLPESLLKCYGFQ